MADKAQTRGTLRETLRVHTLGFRQEAGETRSHAQRPHTWLQARGRQEGRHTRQKRGTPGRRVGFKEGRHTRQTPGRHGRQARGSRGEALADAETGLALADKAQTRGTPGRQTPGRQGAD